MIRETSYLGALFIAGTLLMPACSGDVDNNGRTEPDPREGCTDDLRIAVQGKITGSDKRELVPDSVSLGGQPCEVRGASYSCYERGGGSFEVVATVGEKRLTKTVNLAFDGCHVVKAADLNFEFDIAEECEFASDCFVQQTGCCSCEPATLENSRAVPIEKSHKGSGCLVQCGACSPAPPVAPTVRAACINRQCKVVDVRKQAYSACTVDTDCALTGGSCCGTCGSLDMGNAFAVRKDSMKEFLDCGDNIACPTIACMPQQPQVQAYCAADKHCAVRPLEVALDSKD